MKHVLPALLCLLAAVAPLSAQTDASSLRVRVEDATQAAVAGVRVTALNTATGARLESDTNEEGYVAFSPLARGTYVITAVKQGFKTVRLDEVTLTVDQRRQVRIQLDIANVAEQVEVTAVAAPIQSEQGSLGQVISGRVAVELPLAGRRYTELALLAPGVAPSTLNPQTRGPGWLVSNGNYHTQNNFLLDGIDNNQGTTNAQALSAQVVQPSPDAIAEFKVQTNSYSAEFGRSAGAVINAALKSGSNEVHGSAWLFNRDKALAATPWTSNTFNQVKPDLKWNQFGGTIGGPLVRNKLFYFGDYEGFFQDFSNLFITTVPTAAQRSGVFAQTLLDPTTNQPFPNNTIPAGRIDALGKRLVDLYPAPNAPGETVNGRPRNNYAVTRPGTERTHKFDIKSDYVASERDTLVVRFSFFKQNFFREQIFPGIGDGVGNQGAQRNDNQSSGITYTRILSPSVVNVARYGLNRTYAAFEHATVNGQTAEAFGFRGIPPELAQVGGLPLIDPINYNQLGTRNFRPQFQNPWLNQFVDTLSWNRGAHSLKFGAELRAKNNTFIDITRRTPAYSFQGRYTNDAIADLLLGLPESVTLNTVPQINQRQQAWAFFAQDDWKVRPNLTLNLGLRYEYTTPYYGAGANRNINFDRTTQQLITASDSDRYLIRPDRNNFGPRLGAAWQLVPEKIVLRGGYGIFYNGEDIYGSEVNLPLNPPQLVQVLLLRQGNGPAPLRVSDPIPPNALANFDTRTLQLRTRDRNLVSGVIQQWNAALQFQVDRASTVEVAYVGNRSRDQLAIYNSNQTPFGVDGSVPANRPFPLFGQVQYGVSAGRSWYNALQLRVERRFSQGLNALVSYTYASALDNAGTWDAGSEPQILNRFDLERGPMAQLPRQRLTTATVWELPFGRGRALNIANPVLNAVFGGWQISNILSWRTGLPVNVTLALNGVDPATGQAYRFLNRNGGGLRPNRVGDGLTGISPHTDRLRYLDSSAFQVQAVNTPGNSSRNPVFGPRSFNVDTSLVKRIAVTERMYFDIRAEAFNTFNNVNFANPAATFGTPTFGQITNAADPRIMQLALRFAF